MSEYPIVRAHAMITKFLPPDILKGLAVARSLEDLLTLLFPTEYGKYIRREKVPSISSVKKIVDRVFEDRITTVLKDAPKKVQDFIATYLSKFDIENIINILKFKKAETPIHEILEKISRFYFLRINIEELLEAKNIEELLLKIMKYTGYKIPEHVIELYRKYDSILPLEFYLKRKYFDDVFLELMRLPRNSRRRIENVVRVEVDIENVFNATTSYLHRYSEEVIKIAFIPYPCKVNIHSLRRVISARSNKEVIELLAPYEKVVSLILDGKDGLAKVEGYRIIRSHIRRGITEGFIDIAFIYYFVVLAEIEMRDLHFVTIATQFNVPPKEKIAHLIYAIIQ